MRSFLWHSEDEAAIREDERNRIYGNWKFSLDLVLFLMTSSLLVGVWQAPRISAWLGTSSGFWPGWVILGWLIFLLIHALNTF